MSSSSKKTTSAPAKTAAKPARAAASPAPAPEAPEAGAQPQAEETQATAQAPQVIDPVPASTHAARPPIDRLERARALPELKSDAVAKPAGEPIQSFKDADRRTMNVVTVAGELFKQEV